MVSRPYRLFALLVRPLCWPRWLRRVGLLLLPVSIPCWIALLLLAPFGEGLAGLARGIAKLWNGERRYLYRRDRYEYYEKDAAETRVPVSRSLTPRPAGRSRAEWAYAELTPVAMPVTESALLAQRSVLLQ
jgi:hypothetical protein